MSNKKQEIPAIRFNGFTDAWEQRKLGDTFEFSVSTNSLSRAQLNYEKGNIKSIHYGDILIKYNSILEITKDKIPFITDGSIEKYKPNLLENGDVVFADAAEDETVGKAVEINGISDEYVVAGLHTIVARPKEKMAKYFSGYYINADVYQRQLLRLMQGTKVSSISKGNLKKTIVAYPKNLAEQQKIGSFFKQLDNAIALHQRQLNKYNDLKLTMLQKMFPNNDERAPQVRFDGFTGDWERRKFGDLWRKSSERNSDLKYTSLNVLSVAQMKLNPVERNSTDDYMKTYNVLYYGDIAFEGNKSKNYSFGRFVLNDVQDGIVSHVFISFRPKVEMNIDFMKIYINNENVMKHHLVKATTKTLMMTTLNVHDMNKQFLVIPNIDEQAKIGMFFKKLDDNIALHQKKINHYICLKKSFLQGMFV